MPLLPAEMHSAITVERPWILFLGLYSIIFCTLQLLLSKPGSDRAGEKLSAAVRYGNGLHGGQGMAPMYGQLIIYLASLWWFWKSHNKWAELGFYRCINTNSENGCILQNASTEVRWRPKSPVSLEVPPLCLNTLCKQKIQFERGRHPGAGSKRETREFGSLVSLWIQDYSF